MRALIAIAAGMFVLSACSQGSDDRSEQASSEGSAGSIAATTTAAAAAAPLGKAVSGAQAKKVMHVRHEGMEAIGDAMKVVSGELRKDAPDLAKVRSGAGTFARLAPQVKGWFPPGTGPNVGKTRALPAIWQKPDDFRAKALAFESAAAKFNAAAKGGDVGAIRAAQGELGKACKACHDPYRSEKGGHN